VYHEPQRPAWDPAVADSCWIFLGHRAAVGDSAISPASGLSRRLCAILWRNHRYQLGRMARQPYSVASGSRLGQIVGTGTVAGDNLDHALMDSGQRIADTHASTYRDSYTQTDTHAQISPR
jgi:hypothetical protein